MSHMLKTSTLGVSLAALTLLAGCGEMGQSSRQSVQPAVPYNPPAASVTAMPSSDIAWYHVEFDTNSSKIGMEGQQIVASAAAKMQGNPALVATVIGKADGVGSDASNMRLSRARADAVRVALLATGKMVPKQIETRWTGQRADNSQGTSAMRGSSMGGNSMGGNSMGGNSMGGSSMGNNSMGSNMSGSSNGRVVDIGIH